MTKITIKDVFGEKTVYSHDNLKVWRDGNTVEVYYNKPLEGGKDYRKIIVATATNPALVVIEESFEKPKKKIDPFTQEALESRPDTPEEKALLNAYKSIEGKKPRRKRRTKAEMEAAKNDN